MPIEKVEDVKSLWLFLRSVIRNLRAFLDTNDYKFVTEAYKQVEIFNSVNKYVDELSGLRDLLNNLSEMHARVTSNGAKISLLEHGLLAQQAVYAISRANILSVGLEFKLKRFKGG